MATASSTRSSHWELQQRPQQIRVDVPVTLMLDHESLTIQAALKERGLAYVFERSVRSMAKAGRIVAVLEDGCPTFPGMFLYYPGHRHVPPPPRAVIETLEAVANRVAAAARVSPRSAR